MKNYILYFLCLFIPYTTYCQLVPNNTNYNQGIVWENVFTNGPAGKVNRGLVDSDGNCALFLYHLICLEYIKLMVLMDN